MKDLSPVLLSIFKRKGGEGVYTQIVTESNKFQYEHLEPYISENERLLIVYYTDFDNWTLLTNKRIIDSKHKSLYSIDYRNLKDVNLAMQKESELGNSSKSDFTHLLLINQKSENYLLKLEKGLPFWGIYQLLFHVTRLNFDTDQGC